MSNLALRWPVVAAVATEVNSTATACVPCTPAAPATAVATEVNSTATACVPCTPIAPAPLDAGDALAEAIEAIESLMPTHPGDDLAKAIEAIEKLKPGPTHANRPRIARIFDRTPNGQTPSKFIQIHDGNKVFL